MSFKDINLNSKIDNKVMLRISWNALLYQKNKDELSNLKSFVCCENNQIELETKYREKAESFKRNYYAFTVLISEIIFLAYFLFYFIFDIIVSSDLSRSIINKIDKLDLSIDGESLDGELHFYCLIYVFEGKHQTKAAVCALRIHNHPNIH